MTAGRDRRHALRAAIRQDRIVRHLERTGGWINAFGISRALHLSAHITAKDCAALAESGRVQQEVRGGEGHHSVHYHAR